MSDEEQSITVVSQTSDVKFAYTQIGEEPPGRKFGHYKLRKPIEPLSLSPWEQLVADRLAAIINDELINGKGK